MPNRFAIKFTKCGYVKYISHLDLLRVFKRTFKTASISLKYSQGFNPHPKMSFAQPLSLGYSSVCELIEFETQLPHTKDEIIDKLKDKLPKGIDVLDCIELNDSIKSLAADTQACEYEISFKSDISKEELLDLFKRFLSQDEIFTLKKSKKLNALVDVNIKPMIREASIEKEGNKGTITCLLDSGSTSNLSPELIINAFFKYSNIEINRYDVDIERKKIIFGNNLQF